MKKLLFTLAAMFMASSAFAGHWVVFSAGEFEETLPYGFTLEKEGVSINCESGMVTATEFRFYADSHMTVAAEDGIMNIVLISTAEGNSKYGPGKLYYLNQSRGQYTYDSNMGYWDDGAYDADGSFNAFNEADYEAIDALTEVELYANAQCRCTNISVYVLDNNEPVVEPTGKTGAPTFHGYTTDGIHAYFVEIIPTEESTIYYRVQYGHDGEFTEWAEYEDVLSYTEDGWYRVEAYAVAEGKAQSEQIAYEFVVAPRTGIDELVEGKQVAGVRYFNMAGQEMTEANGLTIVVTTYTDGTTSAVKVVK